MIVNTTYTSGGVVSKRLLLKKVLNRMKKNIFALTFFFFKIHKNITKNNSVNLNDLIHHKGLWKQCHQAAAG